MYPVRAINMSKIIFSKFSPATELKPRTFQILVECFTQLQIQIQLDVQHVP